MKFQITSMWQSPNEPVHKSVYGASVDDLLTCLRELIEGVCRADNKGGAYGIEDDFPIAPMRTAVVEWPAWYEHEFDKRVRLNPRYAIIVGYNLNDFLSSSADGDNQLHRLLDLSKPIEVGKV